MDSKDISLICITDFWFPKIGGMERSIDNLCRTLSGKLPVYLLTGQYEEEADGLFPFEVWKFPVDTGTGYYKYALEWIKKVRTHRIVHVFGFSFFWPESQAEFISEISKLPKTKLVMKIPTSGDSLKYLKTSHLNIINLIDRFIALNSLIARELRECGVGNEQISCIPNGVITSYFEPGTSKMGKQAREKLKLPAGRFLLGFCGRFEHRKRIDLIISAIKEIQVDFRPTLVLMGYSDKTFGTEAEIDDFVDDDIILLPPSNDIRPFYHAIDLYISASDKEGMSNSILEAISCGLPVIASIIPGQRELVEHEKNGLLFETGNGTDLAKCMIEAFSKKDTQTFKLWKKASRAIALKKYKSTNIAADYLSLYQDLVAL